jgi:tetratricopeptide (TPR) repeat protein
MSGTGDLDSELNAALAAHEAGQFAAAEAAYRRILAHDPTHPDALNLLGVLLQDTGDLAGSIASLTQAVAADPGFAEAFANLARAQCAAGDPAAAERNAETALRLDPGLAEAHLHLTRSRLALNDPSGAAAAARQAVSLMPDEAEAALWLGHALSRLDDHAGAVAAYTAAARLRPDQGTTLQCLAIAQSAAGDTAGAVASSRRAAALTPDDPVAHFTLGRILAQAQDLDAAAAALRQGLALAPDRAEVWKQLGDCLALLGRFDQAADCFNRVLTLQPDLPDALSCLAAIGRLPDPSGSHARLRAVIEDAGRPDRDRAVAGFALGAVLDEAGDYAAAFPVYAKANALARQAFTRPDTRFDPAQFRSLVDHIRSVFTADQCARLRDGGDPSELPVFIVGMPRIGTTLVEQILASHGQVFGAGERQDIPAIARVLGGGQPELRPWDWDPDLVRQQAQAHLVRLRALGGAASRVIDKLPDNILLLGHIAALYPNARVILCRRDLRDVGLSCFFQPFGENMDWSFDLADCAARIAEIERLTEHWQAALPVRMLEVRYEDLVADLDGGARRMVDFLGLAWDPRCLSFHTTERAVQTVSFRQVRSPLYASSVGRWRHYRNVLEPLLLGLVGVAPVASELSLHQVEAAALAHLAAGRVEAAEAAFRLVLGADPGNAEAAGHLALLLVQRGAAQDAVALLQDRLARLPRSAPLLLALARVYRVMGDRTASAAQAAAAAAADLGNGPAQLLLGSTRLELDDPDAALPALRQAVRLMPDSADAHLFLGMTLLRQEKFAEACDPLREAVRLRPDDPESLTKLGWALQAADLHEEALLHLRHALDLAPQDGRVHVALVTTLWRKQEVEAATAACTRALEIAPDVAELWLHQGYCHAAVGRFNEAIACHRKALALDPRLEEARLWLINIGAAETEDSDAAHLRQVLADPARNRIERAGAGYALGRLLDGRGAYDDAFATVQAAAALVKQDNAANGQSFDAAQYLRYVSDLSAVFSPEALLSIAGYGSHSELPVFVVGMPRSGTTLVEQIISSHPKVFGAGELQDFTSLAQALENGTPMLPPIAWDRRTITREAAAHLAKLRDLGGAAERVVDKLPDNAQWLGHISALFPRARIIICRRDPRDVCLSCYFQFFGDRLTWTTDQRDLATRAVGLDRLLRHWRAVLPNPIIEVEYETLVGNLERESRRLIDFLGLDWDPACLRFHETERTVLTASMWQVRQPLYASSMGRWRSYRRHLGPLLEGLRELLPVEDAAEPVGG